MKDLFAELKRRNVLRAGAFYAASAWLLVQVATQVLPFFHIVEWVVRWIVVAAVIGFPFALAFSWFYEWTPQGITRENGVAQDSSIARQTNKRLDHWIILVLTIAIVMLLADKFVFQQNENQQAAEQISEKSVAVLAFLDLSPNHDQQYFSDGMSEEILNALAQVTDLKVAGRTSSFYFKDKNSDLRTIGKTLGVAHVLEGSVRKQGDKVRINAQLVRTSDDTHLWSREYDGDMSDVFKLQDNIARAITDQLKVVLVGEQKTRLVPVATASTDAYTLYLRAADVFNRRDGAHFAQAIADLKEASRLDPSYARAHARLAAMYAIASNYTGTDEVESLSAGEREANLAIDLDPTLAEPHAALGVIYEYRREWLASRVALEHAVALDPADTLANFWLGLTLSDTGYRAKGIEKIDRALSIDPLLANALSWRSFFYLDAGDLENASRMSQRALDQGLLAAEVQRAMLAHSEGRDADAISSFSRGAVAVFADLPDGTGPILAHGVFGGEDERARAVRTIDSYLATQPTTISTVVPWALLLLNEPARALSVAQDPRTENDSLFLGWLWSSYGKSARRLPEFAEFTRQMGLTSLWDKYGAPDLCRKQGEGSYACD
ncbi:MAG: tetratricopeptide repeat protein [Rhodanobacteraceae bacterium]